MPELHMTQLSEDEAILFGSSRKAKDSKISVKSEDNPSESTYTSFRTVCITNFRVIIESGGSAIQFPNNDIIDLQITHNGKKESRSYFNILKTKTKGGNSVNIEIVGIRTDKEDQLPSIFPNASIRESRGLGGFLECLLGI